MRALGNFPPLTLSHITLLWPDSHLVIIIILLLSHLSLLNQLYKFFTNPLVMSLIRYASLTFPCYYHRLLSKSCTVMEELKKRYKFECVVGLNGRVWVSAPSLMQTIIIRNCLQASEFMSDDSIREMIRQASLS